MERRVNLRLFNFFEQVGTLSTLQSGSRAKRTSIDHLLSLEATVRKAQANSEKVVSIIFDMEKAYVLTRRRDILMYLTEAGIEGIKFNFAKKKHCQTQILQSQGQRSSI